VNRMPSYPQNLTRFMIDDSAKALLLTIRQKANEAYSVLGKGYSEAVYQRALCVEFQQGNIRHDLEVTMSVPYKGHVVGQVRSDIILRGDTPVVIETKATAAALKPEERWQLSRYMKILDISLGALINFTQVGNAQQPQIEFFVVDNGEIYQYNVDTSQGVLLT
jgi:GxxExxY protein